MSRTASAGAGIVFLLAAVSVSLALAGAATAAGVRCEEKVLMDWSDDGRIDGIYPLHCYQDALKKMPTDLRDYTNASDVIQRALTRAVSAEGERGESSRVAAGTGPQVGADGPTSFPLPLVLLAAISLAVLAAGCLGYLSRRRRERHD